ncbi:MAG: arsenic transporter [Bacillota bacterium]|nr:arsenic transporter [Bacillota bacterium]
MATDIKEIVAVFVFVMTITVIFLRPKGLNEVYAATTGAIILLFCGIVTYSNLLDIIQKIGDASITIISTISMAVILESFGFFHWAAAKLTKFSKGSGYRLYWYVQLLCFLMTLLFNNDGSIMITTPILILLLRNFQLKPHQQILYLLSGALIATSASIPIGVSNIVNLISLKIIGMTLYEYTTMMFIPAIIGLAFMSVLMFLVLLNKLPRKLPMTSLELEDLFFKKYFHPQKGSFSFDTPKKRTRFMLGLLGFVLFVRCLLFIASYIGIPIYLVAVSGSILLLAFRWYFLGTIPVDILKKTPWHILVFAFSMYVIVYGLNNIGLTELLANFCKPIINQGLFHANFLMGGVISLLSNTFNNHPALMIGTITLSSMHLDMVTLKAVYLANIIGSDMGSLFLPIGTLASLIWMHILKKNKIRVSWKEYLSLTIIVIPLSVILTLLMLFYWTQVVL